MRKKLSFNKGWKFVRGYIKEAVEIEYPLEELEKWENVNLPHSLRLEPMDYDGVPTYQGVGMYRNHFQLESELKDKNIFVEFEAVMGVTDVWVNGVHLQTKLANKTPDVEGQEAHTNYGGYLPFVVCLNEVAKFDGVDNVIVVLTDNRNNSQVPPGKPQELLDFTYFGGIYRNVWLETTEKIYITNPLYEDEVAGGGVVVEYSHISEESATINISIHIKNEKDEDALIYLTTEIVDQSGEVIKNLRLPIQIASHSSQTIKEKIDIENPKLWNIDHPYLYTLAIKILHSEAIIDAVETKIGIRSIEVDRSRGLLINGRTSPLLSGVNRHQDYPFIGNAAPSSMQRRDAILFKSAGFNVVRAAHYPMSIDFVEACDELGILLIEATPGWQWYPEGNDEPFTSRVHNNIRQMVRRDRNHPCILAYEVVLNETYHIPYGYTKKSALVALSEQKSAKIATESYGYDHRENANGIDEEADFIFGFQQPLEKTKKAVMFHREYADTWMESYGDFFSRRVTRGITEGFYPGGEARNLIKANKMLWDTTDDNYSLADRYAYRNENKAFVGCTLWTGIDSRGMWSKMSPCGIWDGFRLPKFSYYAFESQRSCERIEELEQLGVKTGPMLFIASNWTEKCPVVDKCKDGDEIKKIGTDEIREIFVYSNVDKVILEVEKDGKVEWSKTALSSDFLARNKAAQYLPHLPFEFSEVPYIYGSTLRAIGYNDADEAIVSQEVKTAGKPKKIQLEVNDCGVPFVADGSDIILVYAKVLDEEGNICSQAINSVYFTLKGNAGIVGDGDRLASTNPINAEAGIAPVYIKASDHVEKVILRASSPGLEDGIIEIDIKQVDRQYVNYTEMGQKELFETMSMNLSSKKVIGRVERDVLIEVGERYYPNSIICIKDSLSNGEITYDLDYNYMQLIATAYIIEGNNKAKFQILLDDILRYESIPDRTQPIQLDVSGSKKLTFRIKSESAVKIGLLSPYFLQEASGKDESELHGNLAFAKEALASTNSQDALNVTKEQGTWMGKKLTHEEAEWWQVDLGKSYDIRNVKVHIGGQMGSDCTHYTYTINTSADGENWTCQVTNKRTSWSNGVLDKFVAKNVRYIRVSFTHIDGVMLPAISHFETYLDYGVDGIDEYNLKGITIEGEDLLFDPKRTEYTLDTVEENVKIRAIPVDENAAVTINGVMIQYPEDKRISSVIPVNINKRLCNHKVIVSVVSSSKIGKKDYIINLK